MVKKKAAKTAKATKPGKPAKTTWQKFEYRCHYKWLKADVEEQAKPWKKVRDGLLKLSNAQLKAGEFPTANESMESAISASLYATVDFGSGSEAARNFDELELCDPDFGGFTIGESAGDGIALKHVEVIVSGLAKRLDDEDLLYELFDAVRIDVRAGGANVDLGDFEDAGGELIEPE